MKLKYTFTSTIWQYQANGGWYFVSLPISMSLEIRENLKSFEEGWGRLSAIAIIGTTEWKTAIWFDTKHNTYLLPLKAEIRKKEKLAISNEVKVNILL